MKLTDMFAAGVKPTQKLETYRDDDLRGFALFVYPTGVKTWYMESRINNKLFKRKIGNVQIYKCREARDIFKKWIGELAGGVDSKLELRNRMKQEKLEAEKLRKAETIQMASDAYLSTMNVKMTTWRFYTKLMENGLAPYAGKPLHEVDSDWIREAFEKISETNTPIQATKCIKYVKSLCLWRELGNPIPPRMRLATPKPRQARLDPQDGIAIWNAVQPYIKTVSGAYLATMLLTGCRTGELSTLTVGQVDMLEGYIKLLDTKNGRDHKVYLSKKASEIIARFIKGKNSSDLVFPKADNGRQVFRQIKGDKDWSNHDLRKLFAIVSMEIGVSYPVIKAALNHSTTDVTLAHYAQATPSQLRACWDHVSAYYTETKCKTSTSINKQPSEPQNESTSASTFLMQRWELQESLESSRTA